MKLQFFWSRTASVWIALLYIILGLPLLLFPGASGSVLYGPWPRARRSTP